MHESTKKISTTGEKTEKAGELEEYKYYSKMSFKQFRDKNKSDGVDGFLDMISGHLDAPDSKAFEDNIKKCISTYVPTYSQKQEVLKKMYANPKFTQHLNYKKFAAAISSILMSTNEQNPQANGSKYALSLIPFMYDTKNKYGINTFAYLYGKNVDNMIFKGKSGAEIKLTDNDNVMKDYNEDIDKPPVFETHIRLENRLNKKFAIADASQHAFVGLRLTIYDPNDPSAPFKRKCFRIGYEHYHPDNSVLRFFLNGKYESVARNEINTCATISTQTSISSDKAIDLIHNMYLYFKKYPYYQLYSRNCNTFVREMAKSIDLNSIASLHNKISPATVGHNMSKMVSKGKNLDKIFAEFDGNKPWENDLGRSIGKNDDIEAASNDYTKLKRPIISMYIFGNHPSITSPLNKEYFLKEAKAAGKNDLGWIDRITHKEFRSKKATDAIDKIADSIEAIHESMKYISSSIEPTKDSPLFSRNSKPDKKKLVDSIIKYSKNTQKHIKKAIKEETGPNHLNLNIYLLRTANMLYQLESAIKTNTDINSRINS